MTDQGDVYTNFIANELAGEIERRGEINSQAARSIVGAGAQFAVVTAVVVFVRGKNYVPGTHWGGWVLCGALVLYLTSVSFALVASRSTRTAVASPQTMRLMLTTRWRDDEVTAKNIVAVAHVNQIENMRRGNDEKARWQKRSVLVQTAAVVALVVGAISLFT